MVMQPTPISIQGLTLRVGRFTLGEISFELFGGEYFVLLGPTGSGKTLLLETICGLNRPHRGAIRIGGRDVTALDPARRHIGYVPQDYALMPFMTVRQNIGFGLQARRIPRPQRRRRIDEVLALTGIASLADRRPAGLSGGERQRVALARALAVQPEVLLLDEPLSAVDDSTGEALMEEMLRLHRRLGATTIHICHRLEEAFRMADTLGVMDNGLLIQHGPLAEVANQPRNLAVARFLRLPNLMSGCVRANGDQRWFCLGDTPLAPVDAPLGPASAFVPLERLSVHRTRPADNPDRIIQHLRIRPAPRHPGASALRLGNKHIELRLPGIYPPEHWPVGAEVFASFAAGDMRLLRDDTPT